MKKWIITFSSLLLLAACGHKTEIGKVIEFFQTVPVAGGLVESWVIVELDDGTKDTAWLPQDDDLWETLDFDPTRKTIRIMIQHEDGIWKFKEIYYRKLKSGEISVAMMPLADNSQEKEQGDLCDRIADGILNRLSKDDALRVISRELASEFKGQGLEINEIGKQLNVLYIIEGIVSNLDNRVKIVLQLIRVSDKSHIWSDSYTFEVQDVLTAQDKIASDILDAFNYNVLTRLE